MKVYKILIAAAFAAVSLGSCKKALEKDNLQNATANLLFADSAIVKLSMDYIYDQNLPNWFGNTGGTISAINTGLTDETSSDNVFVQGTATTASVTDIGTSPSANINYTKIQVINAFIRDVNNGTLEAPVKKRYIAQAYFFRAFRYFEMVRLYGGVPLVLNVLPAVGTDAKADAQLPRNSTTECFLQIQSDLDSAIRYLPRTWPKTADWGHITAGAAAAYKGRVLLTYASPQFNPNNIQSRWQDAYNASTQAITLLGGAYSLNTSYQNMWFTEVNNPEAVMVTGFNNSTADQGKKNNTYDNATRPAYLGTAGGSTQPTWDLVKAYPMLDGKVPGTSTKYTYTDQQFYKNRDPRFDATIAYNGCRWPILGNANYRLWTYYVGTRTTEPTASNTGFYLRKAINPDVLQSNVVYVGTDWMEIRYAEVLLNQAEAAAELNMTGEAQDAYKNLVAIRRRAGLEIGDGFYGLARNMDRIALINAIMYERQIEFAYEGKRFWDLRRRKLLESVLNTLKRRSGLTITLKTTGVPADFTTPVAANGGTSSPTYRDNVNIDVAYASYFTIATKQLDTKYDLNWKPEYYFFAIPPASIDNNPKLQQNNTWGGPFNPLQ